MQNASHPSEVPGDLYNVRGWNWNLFAQDDIRVTPKLTLNLGLRYEIPPAYRTHDLNGVALDPTNGGGFLWANKNFVQQVLASPGVNPNLIRCCAIASLVPRIGKISLRAWDWPGGPFHRTGSSSVPATASSTIFTRATTS